MSVRAPGNLMVLDRNPLEDIGALADRHLLVIMRAGRLYRNRL